MQFSTGTLCSFQPVFTSNSVHHYGFFYPTLLRGTNNIVGLDIILVHTSDAFSYTNSKFTNISELTEVSGIGQDLPLDLINDIKNLLIVKYGPPQDTIKSEFTAFPIFIGNRVESCSSDSINIGELYSWRTEYYNVKFFHGIKCMSSSYNYKQRLYMMRLDFDPDRKFDYENGERECNSYSFISYTLNSNAIKKLGLEKVKL